MIANSGGIPGDKVATGHTGQAVIENILTIPPAPIVIGREVHVRD